MRARILVVDDDRDNADSLARLVGMLGYEAITAYSGPQAIEAAQDLCPEMALIDIGMPGMDGYETAARIRRLTNDRTILVAVTGWSRQEDKQRATNSGFDLHFAKPLSLDALQDLLAIPNVAPAAATCP
jgi:two-component system, chemotaxis family, CheB/CheR fusion protein